MHITVYGDPALIWQRNITRQPSVLADCWPGPGILWSSAAVRRD